MSELKARHIVDVYDSYYAENPFGERSQVYLKSEADKVIADLEESHKMEVEQLLMKIVGLKNKLQAANEQIENLVNSASGIMLFQDKVMDNKCTELRHHKYKRCLAMAMWCKRKRIDAADYRIPRKKWEFYNKWYNRWLELAEKFKEGTNG